MLHIQTRSHKNSHRLSVSSDAVWHETNSLKNLKKVIKLAIATAETFTIVNGQRVEFLVKDILV